jgi:hypothetical protein
MKSGVDILDHIIYIGIMLIDKLIDFTVFFLEWPKAKSLDFSGLDLVYC